MDRNSAKRQAVRSTYSENRLPAKSAFKADEKSQQYDEVDYSDPACSLRTLRYKLLKSKNRRILPFFDIGILLAHIWRALKEDSDRSISLILSDYEKLIRLYDKIDFKQITLDLNIVISELSKFINEKNCSIVNLKQQFSVLANEILDFNLKHT